MTAFFRSLLGKEEDPEKLCSQGQAAFTEGKYEEAVRLYRLAADQGHAAAQCGLGFMYCEGKGVAQSDTEAARLFRLSTDQGYARAQFNLGLMYERGKGVEQNDTEAARLYRLAADQGYAPAQCNLAVMYKQGRGVAQSDAEAVRLYRLAAHQGYTPAQCNLAVMYKQGRGVAQSDAEAVRLYRLAADQRYARAQFNLGLMYCEGRGVEQSEAEAARLFRLAAHQGYARAQFNLGTSYERGKGVEQSEAEAARLYRLAAEKGEKGGCTNLAGLLFKKQESEEGMRYFQQALEGASEADKAEAMETASLALQHNRCSNSAFPSISRFSMWLYCIDCQRVVCMTCTRSCHACLSHRLTFKGLKKSVCQCPCIHSSSSSSSSSLSQSLLSIAGIEPTAPPEAQTTTTLRMLQIEVDMSEENQLGRGSYGAVYRARLGSRWVATKMLWMLERPESYGITPGSAEFRQCVEEFVQEARILASTQHPNIVEFLGIVPAQPGGEREGKERIVPRWIVTELARSSVAKMLQDATDHRVSLAVAMSIGMQVLQGLSFLHHRGIIHRDVKPGNILLFDGEVAKLCDLGIARHFDKHTEQATLTANKGSPAYTAPEVMVGKYGKHADMYSVGITLVEMLTGKVPEMFVIPDDRVNHIQQLLFSPPFSEEIPAGVSNLIVRCVDGTASLRPSSAEALASFQRLAFSTSLTSSLTPPAPLLSSSCSTSSSSSSSSSPSSPSPSPSPLSSSSSNSTIDVAGWLSSLRPPLPQYAQILMDNDCHHVDILKLLDDSDLKEMGISSLGHRKAILFGLTMLP